jgi:hypothetical protein
MKQLNRILGLAAILASAIPVSATDWPMHRGGPQLQGRADMPAPAKPDLLWTYSAGKPIKGGAAIAGGRVFFGDDDGIIHAVESQVEIRDRRQSARRRQSREESEGRRRLDPDRQL